MEDRLPGHVRLFQRMRNYHFGNYITDSQRKE